MDVRHRGGTTAVRQRVETTRVAPDGERLQLGEESLAARYGNRLLLASVPDQWLPEHGRRPVDKMRLIGGELVLASGANNQAEFGALEQKALASSPVVKAARGRTGSGAAVARPVTREEHRR